MVFPYAPDYLRPYARRPPSRAVLPPANTAPWRAEQWRFVGRPDELELHDLH